MVSLQGFNKTECKNVKISALKTKSLGCETKANQLIQGGSPCVSVALKKKPP